MAAAEFVVMCRVFVSGGSGGVGSGNGCDADGSDGSGGDGCMNSRVPDHCQSRRHQYHKMPQTSTALWQHTISVPAHPIARKVSVSRASVPQGAADK